MRREELRTGRVADKEFQFWECWECDENVPEAPPLRHWFRSDTGMEAPTYDHMLQKLYRRALGLPENNPPAALATNEWDRRVPHTLRVNGQEVLIEIIEHYKEENGGAPVSIKVRGPNGLVTSSYQEMLEKLGVVTAGERGQGTGNRESASSGTEPPAPEKPSAIGSQLSAAEPPAPAQPSAISSELSAEQPSGVSSQSSSTEPSLEVREVAQPTVSAQTESATSSVSAPLAVSKAAAAPVTIESSAVAESRQLIADSSSNLRDARDPEEETRRAEAFETEYPRFWDEDGDVEVGGPISSMQLVWWGEYIKAVYPELAAAALDREKYSEYMENYDPERSVPIFDPEDEEDEEAKPIAADAPRCQFIKSDGEPCGSPALKKRRLCHFHSKTADGRKRRKKENADSGTAPRASLEMPVLEDDLAIQIAVTNICRQLANETIDPKRATSLLYGIQVASVAVRRAMQNRRSSSF